MKEIKTGLVTDDEIEKLIKEGKLEHCPNCDNSGGYPVQVSSRQYITKDMATDAEEPSLEGQMYSDDEFEEEQCEWCWTHPKSIFMYKRNKRNK